MVTRLDASAHPAGAPSDILFVHANFPGQFKLVAAALAARVDLRVFAIGSETARPVAGVRLATYTAPPRRDGEVHPFAARFDGECRRAEEVLYAANALKVTGMSPRVIFVHPGWGESLPLRQLFPDAKICVYCEFYYRTVGADVGFDEEHARFGVDGLTRIELRNAATLLALVEADAGIAPTAWQRDTFPAALRDRIAIIHDGIDPALPAGGAAEFRHASLPKPLRSGDEVVTYVARGLEPYRGFHTFMRALPAVLAARPTARICIAGSDRVCYGAAPAHHATWRDALLDELGDKLDRDRLSFLGALPHDAYLDLLRVSRVHAYLTYPFVLSWSLLDAMALGCVVVASDTAPVREVIEHGRNGLLVPFFEPARLAECLIAALADPERHAALAHRARTDARARFAFESTTLPAYLALIARLMAPETMPMAETVKASTARSTRKRRRPIPAPSADQAVQSRLDVN